MQKDGKSDRSSSAADKDTAGAPGTIEHLLSSYYGVADAGDDKNGDDAEMDDHGLPPDFVLKDEEEDKPSALPRKESSNAAASPAAGSRNSRVSSKPPTPSGPVPMSSPPSTSAGPVAPKRAPSIAPSVSGIALAPAAQTGPHLPPSEGIFDMASQTFDAKLYVEETIRDNSVK